MGGIIWLPATFVAFVLGYASGLFRPALRAEFPFVHRAAGTGPAVRCGPGLAALWAEFSGDSCTAGTLPALCCRLRLRLFAAAVRAEAAGDAALSAGAGPARGGRRGRGYRCVCGLSLLLRAHLIEVLGVHAAHLSSHPHAHKKRAVPRRERPVRHVKGWQQASSRRRRPPRRRGGTGHAARASSRRPCGSLPTGPPARSRGCCCRRSCGPSGRCG